MSVASAQRSSRRRTPRTRGSRRKPVLWGIAVLVLVVALVCVAWFTPVLSVRKITVTGADQVPEEQVLESLDITKGTPLLRVDTDAAAKRVAQLPKVAEVRVERHYPSSVRVFVTERKPAVFFDSPQGTHLVDALGVDYAIEPPPPGVPRLKVDKPGFDDPATQAALAVLAATPGPLRVQVGEVVATSISAISLTLLDGRVIVWGSKENSERKAAIALPLLGQPGRTYDVSSPDLPTVR